MKSLAQEIREMLLNRNVFNDNKYNTIEWYYDKIIHNYKIDRTREKYIKDIIRKILGQEWLGLPESNKNRKTAQNTSYEPKAPFGRKSVKTYKIE